MRRAAGRARSRGIAFVFQAANLLPTFTAWENVAFAASGRLKGQEDDPAELLALVGLAAKLDALPAELSGGEAQRVAIARALAQRPALLLCDEPTGRLDSDTGARVLDLIDALQAEYGFAQVTATHDPDVAARHDRAVGLARRTDRIWTSRHEWVRSGFRWPVWSAHPAGPPSASWCWRLRWPC